MVSMAVPDAVRSLERDLKGIFGSRLRSFVMYGTHHARAGHDEDAGHAHHAPQVRTLAVVDSLTLDDLRAGARRLESWHNDGLATPLVVAGPELARSLDVFPLELSAIVADHVVLSGENVFASLAVDATDVRRACEVQARSHLLHLREGFLETGGRGDALSVLILQSAPAFAALLTHLARLDGQPGIDAAASARHIERMLHIVGDGAAAGGGASDVVQLTHARGLSSAEAERLFAPYLAIDEKLVNYVDGWNRGK